MATVDQTIAQTEAREVRTTATVAATAAAEATWPQTRAILRLLLIVLCAAGFIWALYRLTSVLLLLVLSIFFAYLIAPLVELVHRPITLRGQVRLMPRPLAIGIVYLIIFGSLTIIVLLLLPQAGEQFTQLGQQVPTYAKGIKDKTQSIERVYQRLPPAQRDWLKARVISTLDGVGEYAKESAVATGTFVLTHAPWLVLIPILAFFLLKDVDTFRRSALQMLPRGRLRWRGDELFQDVNSTLAAYIRAQLIACLLIGSLCTLGFLLIGVPYALVLGIIAGFLEFIPLVGPLVVAVSAVLLASFGSSGHALVVFLFLAVLRIVHDYVTYPRIIGQGIHLHPLAVILAILCGAELAGIAGVFLAIPVTAIISVTYRHWMEHRGADEGLVATLLQQGDDGALASSMPDEPIAQNQD